MLQGRLFSYYDAQTYRLGANKQKLPVNRPVAPVRNYQIDGYGDANGTKGDVNYQPSRQAGAYSDNPHYKYTRAPLSGTTQTEPIARTDNFSQAGDYYRALSATGKTNLIGNLAADLGGVRNGEIKHVMLSHFYKADPDYGKRLTMAVKGDLSDVERRAARLKD